MVKNDFGKLTLTSGSIGEQTFLSNTGKIRCFPYRPDMMTDSFIHRIADGNFDFTSGCSFVLEARPCYHFLYVYEGVLTLSADGASITGTAGTVIFFYAPDQTEWKIGAGRCRFYEACLAGASLPAYAQLIPASLSYTAAAAGASCISDCIRQLLSQDVCATIADTVRFSKWFNDIFSELSLYCANPVTRREQIPDYMLEMREILDTHYSEMHTLADMERHFDKSRYRLCREFSQYFGISPLQYLNHRRIEQAKAMLLSTTLPVHEIGSLVGIDNTNHFINLFKRETGATPHVFRQEAPVAISELHYPYTPYVRLR